MFLEIDFIALFNFDDTGQQKIFCANLRQRCFNGRWFTNVVSFFLPAVVFCYDAPTMVAIEFMAVESVFSALLIVFCKHKRIFVYPFNSKPTTIIKTCFKPLKRSDISRKFSSERLQKVSG